MLIHLNGDPNPSKTRRLGLILIHGGARFDWNASEPQTSCRTNCSTAPCLEFGDNHPDNYDDYDYDDTVAKFDDCEIGMHRNQETLCWTNCTPCLTFCDNHPKDNDDYNLGCHILVSFGIGLGE